MFVTASPEEANFDDYFGLISGRIGQDLPSSFLAPRNMSSTARYHSSLTRDSMIAAFSLERGLIKHLKGFGNLTDNEHQ
jgi:hypothetical protein